MSLPPVRSRFWFLAFAVFVGILWLLKPILLPFAAGLVIAYFLDPVVNAECRWLRFPRWLATLFALSGFVAIVVFISLLTIPLLQEQIGALIDAIPGYVENLRAVLLPWAQRVLDKIPSSNIEQLRNATGEYAGSVMNFSGKLLQGIMMSGVAVIDVLALLVITPVVAFYLLRDWPKLTKTVDEHLPRPYYGTIRNGLREIDSTLSGFLRGQALVCLCLGLIYGTGLTLVGLKYGATIGIVAGFLSFIPYAGSTFVLIASMLLAFVQFDSAKDILLTLSVFLVGQGLEGYVLTPKLVGDRVGLHPVWILFALFSGASLFGFLGVLIAVPVAAVIGVLVRFASRRYKTSAYYRDQRETYSPHMAKPLS